MEILEMDDGISIMLDPDKCIECGGYVRACPKGAITVSNVSAPKKKSAIRTGRQKQKNIDSYNGNSPMYKFPWPHDSKYYYRSSRS
jgi:ferredoxin